MRVAIVGAGAAGAGAAYALSEAPVDADVTVFEKSGGVCGRAATRRRGDCTYEYGANYLKDEDPRVTELVTERLPTEGLVNVEEPVWTFDAEGAIGEGDRREDHKWTYRRGITQLAKRLFAATDAEVRRKTRVTGLAQDGGAWSLTTGQGDAEATHEGFDAAVLTPPAPRTADLLRAAG